MHSATTQVAECSVASLQALGVINVTIDKATVTAADGPKQAYCDVRGTLVTDGDGAGPNSAVFTLQLPEHWNNKLLFGGSRGTGGMLGSSANAPDIDLALERGYVQVTTDSGHSGSDEDWFYTEPGVPNVPKLADYYYRAVHQVSVAARALVKGYYGGQSIAYAYFDGCSNGGRNAAMEAIRYPDDFDGIIMGCPWLDPAGSALLNVKRSKAFLDASAHITPDKFDAINAAVLEQCDAMDGVRDELIQNPARCDFDPHSIVPQVLTAAQADALDNYLSGVRDDEGNLVAPGSSVSDLHDQFRGVRRLPDGSTLPAAFFATPAPYPQAAEPWGDARPPHIWGSAQGVLGRLAYNDPSLDMNNSIYEANGAVSAAVLQDIYTRLGADIVGDPARIKGFLDKGGKILMYHGLSDVTISGTGSILYYEALAELHGGYDKIRDSVRFFTIPGMQHCNDGPEPVFFDSLTAMERWVEHGEAPASMIASYTSDWGKTPVRSMPICPFPAKAAYDGSGDVNAADSWSCPANDRSMLELGRNGVQAGLNDLERYGAQFKGSTPALTVQ